MGIDGPSACTYCCGLGARKVIADEQVLFGAFGFCFGGPLRFCNRQLRQCWTDLQAVIFAIEHREVSTLELADLGLTVLPRKTNRAHKTFWNQISLENHDTCLDVHFL